MRALTLLSSLKRTSARLWEAQAHRLAGCARLRQRRSAGSAAKSRL